MFDVDFLLSDVDLMVLISQKLFVLDVDHGVCVVIVDVRMRRAAGMAVMCKENVVKTMYEKLSITVNGVVESVQWMQWSFIVAIEVLDLQAEAASLGEPDGAVVMTMETAQGKWTGLSARRLGEDEVLELGGIDSMMLKDVVARCNHEADQVENPMP